MRFRVIRVCYFILICLVVLRLASWQILRSDDLVARAEDQRLTSQEIPAPRGNILFSDGSYLASTQPTFLVYAQPKIIQDKEATSKALADMFWSLDIHPDDETDLQKFQEVTTLKDSIFQKISQDLFWVNLGRIVDLNAKQKIEDLKLTGVGFQQDYRRYYPEGSSSAHLLGFVGSDSYGNPTGYFGLEGYYNGELKGRSGTLTEEKDAQGLPILIGEFNARSPQPGETLTLNIDRAVQHIVEQKLSDAMNKYGAKSASAIVMDPKTGGIIALASYPNYDPGDVQGFPSEYFKDGAIADTYEPGSTFKTLIMSAAINEHLVKPDTQCDDTCSGPVDVGGYTIRTWDNHYFPHTTMTDVIIHSDNTGMVFVSRKLGLDKLYSYIQKFGIGSSTGVDLQDESSPDLRPKSEWKEIDQATASFGQGIAVTPLQLVRAVASIANGGKLMEPHVVTKIQDGSKTFTIAPRVISQPISADTAKIMTDIMVQEVDKGEAQYYKKHEGVENFKIAGKTGTAQIPVAGHYDPTKTIASFVGFAPADNPKFVMLVKFDEPTSSIYGADTAAPTFFDISKDLFNYYGITPNEF